MEMSICMGFVYGLYGDPIFVVIFKLGQRHELSGRAMNVEYLFENCERNCYCVNFGMMMGLF